ncbi:MAG: ACP S-malonyltransferase [Dehalococcoidia bacterium]|nr:ACP S-malonyltransferase [Dehalococcoidia bacterium]
MAEQEGIFAYVFPGQGSQRVGMGRDLYGAFAQAREVFEEADDALGFSLSRLCFEGPERELAQTVNAQPAILTVSIACLKSVAEVAGGLICPVFMAGHSLGEYTALVAAQVLDFKDAVRLTRQRGKLMQEAGERVPGGMAAIIALDEVSMEAICEETGAQIANINSPGQIVISGTKPALVRAMDLARAMGARHIMPLKVSGAFHSPLMQPAAEGMAQALSQLSFRDPNVPIVVNSTAHPVTTANEIKDELVRQLSSCVQWQKSVEYMVDAGVSTFIEIGPGQVLSGLIKRIDKEAQTLNVGDASSIRAMAFK